MKRCWREISLLVPHLWSEILPQFLEERGFSGCWLDEETKPPHRLVLRVYLREERWDISVEKELAEKLEELSSIFPSGLQKTELRVRVIEEADWGSKWLRFFEPLKIGSIWIRPQRASTPSGPGEEEIVLEPGQAFGTGHHESTRLCLESILLLRPSLEDEAYVLDVGTGSGVLAMFAAKVGFRNVIALDKDPVAVETARRNIAANGLQNFIQVTDVSLDSEHGRFRLILANLSAPALYSLAEELRSHLDEDGWLVVAGLLTGQAHGLLRSFRRNGLEVARKLIKNDWICLILRTS